MARKGKVMDIVEQLQEMPELTPAQYWEAQASMWHENYKEAADEIEQLRKYVQILETGLKLANRNANHWEDALVELATSTFHSVEDYKKKALEALKVNNYPN